MNMATMKTYRVDTIGSIQGIGLREVPRPQPGPHEVLVRVRANALNFRDLMVACGMPVGVPIRTGLVPVSDGAGDVVEVGAAVTRVKPGDRVVAIFRQNWIDGERSANTAASDLGGALDGMLREYVVLSEQGLLPLAPHLSYAEGASLVCAGVTAWNAVVTKGKISAGETVLVQGSGGVSLFALQFAKLSGARVIATTSSQSKAERLLALGADAVVNYTTTPEWHSEVLRLTGGHGVDLVAEVGGDATLARSMQAARVGGRIILIGSVAVPESAPFSFRNGVIARELTVGAVRVGSRAHFEAMMRAIEVSGMKPVIDRSFAFEQALDAYRYLASGAHVGKVVIEHG
jgi:NADPH:quinone reductase-like Zn-dependent oxidoreductase